VADSLNFSSFRPSENRVGSNGSHENTSGAIIPTASFAEGEGRIIRPRRKEGLKRRIPFSLSLPLCLSLSLSLPLSSRRRENSNARTREGTRARRDSPGGNWRQRGREREREREREIISRLFIPLAKLPRLLPLSRPSAGPNRTKLMSRHY